MQQKYQAVARRTENDAKSECANLDQNEKVLHGGLKAENGGWHGEIPST